MTRKTQTQAAQDAPADTVELAVPETGGSFERQPDGSLKRLNDIVEDAAVPASDQPADESTEG